MKQPRLVVWPDEYRDRSLLELVERDDHTPPLTMRERWTLLKGYTISLLAILAFLLLVGLAGGSDLVR